MRARICSAFSCDMFARVVWLRLRRVRDYRISFCYLPHALATHYFLRITRARGGCFLRGRKALLNDFCRAFGHSKAREEKSYFMFLRGRTMFAPTTQSQSPLNSQNKRFMPIRFFFCICRRKRKSYQKENAEIRFRALRSTTRTPRPRPASL